MAGRKMRRYKMARCEAASLSNRTSVTFESNRAREREGSRWLGCVNVTGRMTIIKIPIGNHFCCPIPVIQAAQTPEADPIGVLYNLKTRGRIRVREVYERKREPMRSQTHRVTT